MGAYFKPLPVTIYVDMDGVIAAWTEAIFSLYGQPLPEGKMPYEVQHTLNVDEDEMWDRINSLGAEWWENLQPYPWFRDLWSRLHALGHEVAISTSPCRIGNSAMGKTRWIRKHIGPEFRRYMIGADKWRLAHPRAVLIDDSEEKLAKFVEHGGIGILFPRQWNSGPEVKPEQLVDHVVSNVQRALLMNGLPA